MTKLGQVEREIAVSMVEALVEYGLISHLASSGERSTEDWYYDNHLLECGFWVAGGLSKVCIGHNDLERWVIKVGYTENVKIDHAAREYDNYCLAVEEGLACYFPTTIYLGTFGGLPFYVQEKAICNENQITSNWYDCLCDEFEHAGKRYDPDEIWDTIWDMSDEEKADLTFHDDELTVFLAENRIGDLHEGNFGTIGGLLVIIDFSGWWG